MLTLRLPASLAVFACFLPVICAAQENAAPEQAQGSGLRGLRQTVEQQSARIDELSRQVARLAALIEKNSGAASTSAPTQPTATVTQTPAAPEVRKAEPAPAGPTHEVAKGETLTSIARHYKVGVGDLMKANKIVDDRKLQIGQTLTIPTKNADNTEPTPTPTGGN